MKGSSSASFRVCQSPPPPKTDIGRGWSASVPQNSILRSHHSHFSNPPREMGGRHWASFGGHTTMTELHRQWGTSRLIWFRLIPPPNPCRGHPRETTLLLLILHIILARWGKDSVMLPMGRPRAPPGGDNNKKVLLSSSSFCLPACFPPSPKAAASNQSGDDHTSSIQAEAKKATGGGG